MNNFYLREGLPLESILLLMVDAYKHINVDIYVHVDAALDAEADVDAGIDIDADVDADVNANADEDADVITCHSLRLSDYIR